MATEIPPQCFDIEEMGPSLVVRFTGHKVRLGEEHLRLLMEQVNLLVKASDCNEVVLDLNQVDTVASNAMVSFESLHQKLAERDFGFRLVNLAPHVYELFEVTQLYERFDIRPMAVGVTPTE